MMPTRAFPARITGPRRWTPQTFYEPSERGLEAKIRERIAFWNELRRKRNTDSE